MRRERVHWKGCQVKSVRTSLRGRSSRSATALLIHDSATIVLRRHNASYPHAGDETFIILLIHQLEAKSEATMLD